MSVYTVLFLKKDIVDSHTIGVYTTKEKAISSIIKRLELVHDYFQDDMSITRDEVIKSLKIYGEICWTETYIMAKYKINQNYIDNTTSSDEEDSDNYCSPPVIRIIKNDQRNSNKNNNNKDICDKICTDLCKIFR